MTRHIPVLGRVDILREINTFLLHHICKAKRAVLSWVERAAPEFLFIYLFI